MHMADALISPAVGATMIAVTAGLAAFSIKKSQTEIDQKKIPLMGVMGAFVFAAQMINFSIPGTGSSGHLGGGLLLAALLGPSAGFLTMAAILLIQALFFADGGLLAYGCNVFNLAFFSCFIVYPLIFRFILRKGRTNRRIWLDSVLSAVLGLQLGAISVVLETLFSGKTELPFSAFLLMMQPIHLAIGVVEGLVTASIVTFIWKARPEILDNAICGRAVGRISLKKVVSILAVLAILTGGILSWFASANPDGLEWSILHVTGTAELTSTDSVHQALADVQESTAILPDYNYRSAADAAEVQSGGWPAAKAGTSLSGIIGGVLTLLLTVAAGLLINALKRRSKKSAV